MWFSGSITPRVEEWVHAYVCLCATISNYVENVRWRMVGDAARGQAMKPVFYDSY